MSDKVKRNLLYTPARASQSVSRESGGYSKNRTGNRQVMG